MSSENKTPNIGLNQWQGNEYVRREDFVNDNLIIDREIKDLQTKTDEVEQNAKNYTDTTAAKKVDKVAGKKLSTEDYTTAEKNKLAGIQAGAQVNRGISDSVSSTSSTTDASSKAVKTAYDKGNSAYSLANTKEPKITKKTGFNLNKSDSVSSTSTGTLATSKAVKTAYDRGNSAYSKVTSASYIRDKIKTVDGSGSGLDADMLDGKHAGALELPVGTVITYAKNTPPTGYLECNGAAISKTTYSALFSVIGTVFGTGNGSTTFNIPDLRGVFVRGFDKGRGIDTTRTFGTYQEGTAFPLYYGASRPDVKVFNLDGQIGTGTTSRLWGSNGYTDRKYTKERVRPVNVSLMYCIKY